MATKNYNPTTPGQRGLILIDRSELHKGKPCKSLVKGLPRKAGRNSSGKITVRHQGGGHKRSYRLIDFKRAKRDVFASVERIEYDPNRTAFIALLNYEDGTKAYILAPQRLAPGDKVISSTLVDVKPGNASSLSAIPLGTIVHNVELKSGKGGQFARSAGSYVQLVGREGSKAFLKMPSGELRTVSTSCWATIGAVSNPDNFNQNFGKAGRKRWMGVRPTVRGVAMNPIDHPHGGGEGKTSGGRHPCTPWGILTRGVRTRRNKTTNKNIVRRRG